MSELRDRVVVLTGAAGNVGTAAAKAFDAAGARVVLVDHSAEHVKKRLGELATRHRIEEIDLGDEIGVRDRFAAVRADLGRIDALVTTVGGYVGGHPVADTAWATWERMLIMNVKTTLTCARAVLPHFAERGEGSIVSVASLASLAGGAGESAYAGSKAALLRLVESLAAETKGQGVRVNAVLPGTIDTPENRTWMNAEQTRLAIDPNAIADVLVFLSSDRARAINGAAIKLTGAQ